MKKIWSILLAVALVFTLSVGALAADEDEIPGSYTLYNMDDGSGEDNSEAIAALAAMGMTGTLEIREDGSAVLDLFGETIDLEFDFEKETVIFVDDVLDYDYEDGYLTFGDDEATFVFTKGELEVKGVDLAFDYYVLEEYMESGEPDDMGDDLIDLIVFSNGKALLRNDGDELELVFDYDEGIVYPADDEDDFLPFSIEDDLLYFWEEEGATDTYISFRLTDPGYVGPYVITEAYSEEDGDLTEQLAALAAFGMTPTLTIDEDGVGVVDMFGETETLYFDFDDMTFTTEEDEVTPFTYAYGRITMERDDAYLVFSRTLPVAEDVTEDALAESK
jgi:FtsP/CotA-like multicopper oxidase with cupredoxin domain